MGRVAGTGAQAKKKNASEPESMTKPKPKQPDSAASNVDVTEDAESDCLLQHAGATCLRAEV